MHGRKGEGELRKCIMLVTNSPASRAFARPPGVLFDCPQPTELHQTAVCRHPPFCRSALPVNQPRYLSRRLPAWAADHDQAFMYQRP